MRSLKRVFLKIRKDNPYWSDYVCFAEAIARRKFSKRTISYHFNRLVDRDDYAKRDKKEILEQLFELSNEEKR